MASEPRRSKPKMLTYGDLEVAKVYERVWEDPNRPIGADIRAERGVSLFGLPNIFKHLSNKRQADLAMRLGVWFFRYARWIKSRPEGKV